MGSICSKKELTTKGTNNERSSCQPVISCPLAAFPTLPPTPRPPRAFLSKQQKAGSPLGWGPYQTGSGAGFSPIPFITSLHPHFITQSSATIPSLLLPLGLQGGRGEEI